MDGTKMSQSRRQHDETGTPKTEGLLVNGENAVAIPDNPAWRIKRPSPWPYKPQNSSALAWWRRLPSDLFHDTERSALCTTLKQISVLHADEDIAAALDGDPRAAIGVALSLMPMEEIDLPADIAMTALLRCAIDGNAAASLVLTQALGLSNLGHPFATELAASWYTHGLRHATDPRKFSEAEAPLLKAFREREEPGWLA